ncbi:restriction endonuclease subunit S, partial [Ideonella alba]
SGAGSITFRPDQGISTPFGVLCRPSLAGITSPAYAVFQIDETKVNRRFAHALFRSNLAKAYFRTESTGIIESRLRLYPESLLSLRLALPSLEQQARIAGWLDRETARIDALIEKKTRFIELLREKRQALITQAVTRGLDRDTPLKDSGVDWLGLVPSHWRVMSLKQVVAIPITDGPHETPVACAEGVPFVSAEAVSTGRIDFSRIWGFISEEDDARFSKKYRPRRGDIFMVKSGATTGVTAIVDTDERFNIWSPLAVIRCGDKVLPEFMLNFMRSRNFQEAIALNWSFGTQQNIGMGVIGNLRVAVPPIEEQIAAVRQLDVWLSRIASLELATAKSVGLLRERRAALITAAVTGQIEVRAEVPEEQPEPA